MTDSRIVEAVASMKKAYFKTNSDPKIITFYLYIIKGRWMLRMNCWTRSFYTECSWFSKAYKRKLHTVNAVSKVWFWFRLELTFDFRSKKVSTKVGSGTGLMQNVVDSRIFGREVVNGALFDEFKGNLASR